jgi:hypothetical protein
MKQNLERDFEHHTCSAESIADVCADTVVILACQAESFQPKVISPKAFRGTFDPSIHVLITFNLMSSSSRRLAHAN